MDTLSKTIGEDPDRGRGVQSWREFCVEFTRWQGRAGKLWCMVLPSDNRSWVRWEESVKRNRRSTAEAHQVKRRVDIEGGTRAKCYHNDACALVSGRYARRVLEAQGPGSQLDAAALELVEWPVGWGARASSRVDAAGSREKTRSQWCELREERRYYGAEQR